MNFGQFPVGHLLGGDITGASSDINVFDGLIISDWLLTNGQQVSQQEYPELYALMGNKFGNSDPGMFRLPNFNCDPNVPSLHTYYIKAL